MSVSEIDRHLGRRISQARQARGLDQETLAGMILTNASDVLAMEEGRMRVPALALSRISRVMERPISWFYAGLPGQDVFETGQLGRRSV